MIALLAERDRALEVCRRLLVVPDLAERGAEVPERATDLVVVPVRLGQARRALERLDAFELLEALELRQADGVQRHQLRLRRADALGELDGARSPANGLAAVVRRHLLEAVPGVRERELGPFTERLEGLDRFGGALEAVPDAPHPPVDPGEERQRDPAPASVAALPPQLEDPGQELRPVARLVEAASLLRPEEEEVGELGGGKPSA